MINCGRCITLVLLDTLSICQQNTIIVGSEHCKHARVSSGLLPLTFQFLIDINSFELTGEW